MHDFYELVKELESRGEHFTAETLALLPYSMLYLAAFANAGEAQCSFEMVEAEQRKRRSEILGTASAEDVVQRFRKGEIDAEMFRDALSERMEPLPILPDEDAPSWLILYRAMTDLRGSWIDGRENTHLKRIYRFIPKTIAEGIVPKGWVEAVKRNADKFDGEYCDGRIMRDGSRTSGMTGNAAFMLTGDDRTTTEDGFHGSYTELVEEVLPAELVPHCFRRRE